MKYKMQQSKFSLPVTATDATYICMYIVHTVLAYFIMLISIIAFSSWNSAMNENLCLQWSRRIVGGSGRVSVRVKGSKEEMCLLLASLA